MKKLTILIPSRNRPEKVKLQSRRVLDITKKYGESIDVVISDNSDIPLKKVDFDASIKIIRSSSRFLTFEEHFFWALRKIDSEFVWTLGDDDEPQSEALDALMKMLINNKHDIIVFNGLRETREKKLKQMIPCSDYQIEVPYRQFLMSAGIWGVGAGISLCVFRRSCIKTRYLSEIEKIGSPIYSHVILFLRSFHQEKFIFLNQPLVIYKRSDPEAQLKRSRNWEEYSENTARFYRYPWTTGFVKQMSYLVQTNTMSISELTQVLEFDENGKRYFLLDSLQMMLLEALDFSFFDRKGRSIQMTKSDVKYLYSGTIGPQVLNHEVITLVKKIDLKKATQSREVKKQFRSLQSNIHSRLNNYEVRFSPKNFTDYSEFNTPNGSVQIAHRHRALNNLILNQTSSVIGAEQISQMPQMNQNSIWGPFIFNILYDFRLLIFLLKHPSSRQFIKERGYIYFRGLYIRRYLPVKLSLSPSKLRRKLPLNLRFYMHTVIWKIISFFWMNTPIVFRRFVKKTLSR